MRAESSLLRQLLECSSPLELSEWAAGAEPGEMQTTRQSSRGLEHLYVRFVSSLPELRLISKATTTAAECIGYRGGRRGARC